MKLKKIAKLLDASVIFMRDGDGEKDIESFYCGDLLSRVISKAPTGCGWLTIINNLNVAGVAVLAEIPLVILCEGVTAQPALENKLREEGITLLQTDLTVYECCERLAKISE